MFFKYGVTKRTEQTYSAYSNSDLEFVSFIFRNLPTKLPFLKWLPLNHTQFLWKGSHSKYPHSGFPERLINYESHAITLVLQNRIQFKRYSLDQYSGVGPVWQHKSTTTRFPVRRVGLRPSVRQSVPATFQIFKGRPGPRLPVQWVSGLSSANHHYVLHSHAIWAVWSRSGYASASFMK